MKAKKKQKELGQYLTPGPIADLVTEYVSGDVASAIDLAAGFGDLLSAIQRRYECARISAIDVDPLSVDTLRQRFPEAGVILADALSLDGKNEALAGSNALDLTVGNPPFNKQAASPWVLGVIKDELGLDCSRYSTVRAEIAFLALSLSVTKPGGFASLVLPRTIIAGESWQWLREHLLKRHQVVAVASLPSGAFRNTEVETCVITMKKGTPTAQKISILECDKQGTVTNTLMVDPVQARTRLDYDYHYWHSEYGQRKQMTLENAGVRIIRGNIHSKRARDLGIEVFHTSNFSNISEGIVHFKHTYATPIRDGLVAVHKDDLLVPRVGRNLCQMVKVASGESIISDCIFALRAPKEYSTQLHKTLDSEHAKAWIKVHTSGACAKVISKASLLSMPMRH